MTPIEQAVAALNDKQSGFDGWTGINMCTDETLSSTELVTSVISALREGAVERLRGRQYTAMRMGVELIPEQIVDAILGPIQQNNSREGKADG